MFFVWTRIQTIHVSIEDIFKINNLIDDLNYNQAIQDTQQDNFKA